MKNLLPLLRSIVSTVKLMAHTAIIALLGVCCWPSFALSAQNYLNVGDPRTSWHTYKGTIEEATLSITPQGAYWEVGMYLTFSARGTQWYNKPDSLEISFFFDLPAGVIMHDSWLWIGDDIIKARLLDRWTARAIYEGYVKRRTDPSILYKNGPTQYELRIFPMAGNETRKVKLSYLLPAQWSPEKIQAALPVDLLKSSRYTPKVIVLAWANSFGKNPTVEGNPGAFILQNSKHPDLFQANFGSLPAGDIKILYKTPNANPYYVTALGSNNEGFYQVSFLPGSLVAAQHKKKIALLLDFDLSGGNTTTQELLNTAKNTLLTQLTPSDSFNLIFSNFSIKRASNYWLPADAATIESAFKAFQNPLSNYSNMMYLLANGIDFVKKNGSEGHLMLITNASQVSSIQAANPLLEDVLKQMPKPFPIHTVNYYKNYQVYQYINGTYYYGNAYFLSLLSAQTKGVYQDVRQNDLQVAVSKAFVNLLPTIEPFDFHTKLANGFCYGRFYPNGDQDVAYIDQPIVQIGKYKGSFPFKIEVSGEFNGHVFNQEISVPESEIIPGDSLLREMWFGAYLRLLESENQQNNIIQEIISTSLKERVLSRYTAFFCPEDTSLICATCIDETNLTDVDGITRQDSLMSAYPNPFNSSVNIRINSIITGSHDATLEIMTIDGRLVKIFDLQTTNDTTTVQWDGTGSDGKNTVAGVYLALLKTGNKTSVMKLVKVE